MGGWVRKEGRDGWEERTRDKGRKRAHSERGPQNTHTHTKQLSSSLSLSLSLLAFALTWVEVSKPVVAAVRKVACVRQAGAAVDVEGVLWVDAVEDTRRRHHSGEELTRIARVRFQRRRQDVLTEVVL